jgi:DNA-binding PadR family transcriptional regulator
MDAIVTTRAALLLALRRGPACGLDLIERLRRPEAGRIRIAEGSVYPLLGRLEVEQLVRRLPPRARRSPGRARVDYELTVAGVRASDEMRDRLRRLVHRSPSEGDALDERLRERVRAGLELTAVAARLHARANRGLRM